MAATNESFSATMQALGSPSELSAETAPTGRPLVNAHIHLPPNFTAFETTPQAVALADAQDVRVLGASNYYDYTVYRDFAAEASRHNIFPLFGLEIISLIDALVQAEVRINDPGNPGKMYICGKGITRFDPLNSEAQTLLQKIRDNDSARMDAVTDRLAAIFADAGLETGLDADAIKDRIAKRHQCPRETVYLQERHLAQAFQEVLFEKVAETDRAALLERAFGGPAKSQPGDAVGIQNDIRSYLMKAGKPAFVPDTFVGFDHAYRLILALGGIPCYPTLADGVQPITQYERDVESLVADLKGRGVVCAEFIPLRNTPEALSAYVHAVRDAGLFVTAGTEHNTLDLLPIAPVCLNDAPIPDDIQEIFWEGACVVAAHQYLTINGKTGYVDAEGKPNADYDSDDARIAAFRALGATVIARYGEACAQKG